MNTQRLSAHTGTLFSMSVAKARALTISALFTPALLLLIPAASVAQAATTIVVSGLGGNAEYDEQFIRYSNAIAEHARQLTDSDTDVVLLQDKQATKKAILDAIAQLQQRSSEDSIRIFLLGHGTFDGNQYKYNIPGPDLTGSEITNALNQLPANQQLVVVATSASGAVLEPLQAAHRAVITATKNGRERNAVKFTEHLVAGLTDTSADIDKDETINAQELFQYAERAVAKHYENEKLLASEHARLGGDNAAVIELARYGSLLANKDEIPEDLITERKQISARITSLRNRKSDLTEDDYFDQLQTLMLELASVQRAIDEPAATTTEEQSQEQQLPQPSDNSASPAASTDKVSPGVD